MAREKRSDRHTGETPIGVCMAFKKGAQKLMRMRLAGVYPALDESELKLKSLKFASPKFEPEGEGEDG